MISLLVVSMVVPMLNVKSLPTAEEIQKRVNDRYDDLFFTSKSNERMPFVCSICDEFLLTPDKESFVTIPKMKKMKDVLCWGNYVDNRRSKAIEEYFRFDTSLTDCKTDISFVSEMVLSPRGVLDRVTKKGRNQFRFSACKRCAGCVDKQTLPRHAILNGNYVGVAPECLKELTEVELAFLTPVKGYGYCFTWAGGKQRNLKGTMTFMRVQKRSVVKAVCHLEAMGFNDNVLVLYTGGMTETQLKKARERTTIRTAKVIAAAEWLCQNHTGWKDVDLVELRRSLAKKTPVVYDRSHEVESENANIECEEQFTCYYPDSATNTMNGGFEKPESFKEYVEEMAKKGFDVEFEANLQRSFVSDGDAEVLMDACLMQFPYGIGHMNERRKLPDGSWTTRSDLIEYLQHLSRISQVGFQTNFFQLVLYSLGCKSWLLKTSRLTLRGKTDARNLAENLCASDVISCINGRRLKNRHAGTTTSRKLLDAVDATARSLPHTNEASKNARALGEAMQHHFGMSSVFLTVTFDDENSLLMQVMSGVTIDDGTPVDELNDFDVCNRAAGRRELRLKFPGIATMNFELLLEILLSEVIGWDMKHNCPNGKDGFFGIPEALSFAVEEQGRKTLHVHMSIWIRAYKELKKQLFFGNLRQKRDAKGELQAYNEHICSTSLFPTEADAVKKSFEHECVKPLRQRGVPVVVPDQQLRNLRYRQGYNDSKGLFAYCPDCDKTWTYEEMVNSHVRRTEVVCVPVASHGMLDNEEQIPKARMMSRIMDYQLSKTHVIPKGCINATYQHHVSCHVSNCFKCQKKGSKKRGHVCGPECECRYRMPDLKRRRAELLVEKNAVKWYLWNGDHHEQPLIQVCPRRGKYDLFQNVSCNAISHSKFSCNSNVSCVIDGPIGAYQHKYKHKENQKEETADYAEVCTEVKKFATDRKHADDRSEALRRICRAAFAHNKSNIVSATFASYLLRHESRFYFSHTFQFCPLKDLVRLHNKQEIKGRLKYTPSGDCYFENHALHYLCRPREIEDSSLRFFVENFFVCSTYREKEAVPFLADTGFYQHPSVLKRGGRNGTCAEGVKERADSVLIRVSQWMFPDTASFKCNIFECDESQMNSKMEEYAQLVLTLFLPHRHIGDLKPAGSSKYPYVMKLREVYHQDVMRKQRGEREVVFTKSNIDFLQNLQDARSNSLRYKMSGDPLAMVTKPYQSENPQEGSVFDKDDDDDEEEIDEVPYEAFTKQLEAQFSWTPTTDEDPEFLNETLRNFKFDRMKDKGRDDCGYDLDIEVESILNDVFDFVKIANAANTDGSKNPQDSTFHTERERYSVSDIINLWLRKKEPRQPTNVWKGKTVDVRRATGSIKSIREWSKACFGSDKKQQRAFEVLISSFLLTFYDEKPEDVHDATEETTKRRSKYRRAKRALKRLRGIGDSKNLICLLHGSGGSGKSTVINTVKAYAADYCAMLGHKFTSRTIVVTAMSGVAATLLGGETTHKVLGLNRDTIQNEEKLDWLDARLLIIDEVSFASAADFQKMHKNLCSLMENRFSHFGGLNVVFAGDYSQLEPVGRDPVYKDGSFCPEFQGALNSYIELDGKWRFIKDPEWGNIMSRFREGNPTADDIRLINDKCSTKVKTPPVGIQVATYTNKDRDAINAAIFDKWTSKNKPANNSVLKSACLVFMDNLYMNDGSKTPVAITSNMVKRHFYENCTESECNFGKGGKGRVDPVLKLYPNCPMMLTQNTDVANGEANGSRVRVQNIVVKAGETPFTLKLDNGSTVYAVYCSQVESISLEHENEDIVPRQFDLSAKTFNFQCRMQVGMEELYTGIRGDQFPIISNSCTTGHKLQGCTVDTILANDWYYGANWVYVVLSRVKTMSGLYIRKPLSFKLEKYDKPEDMKKMLQVFRERILIGEITLDEYRELEKVGLEDDDN